MNEIIIYQPDDQSKRIEVRVEHDTIWLNRHQMASLFDRDVKTIGKHVSNALNEELKGFSVVAKFATTATDGKVYQVEHYNLDVIISVGYRVKSNRGIQFRQWANKVLKDYLLKGYAVSRRVDRIEDDVHQIKSEMGEIRLRLNTSLTPEYGIFYRGQIFDAYTLIADIIRSASKSIVLIDNYIDDTVLKQFAKRRKNVIAIIYTKTHNKTFLQDIVSSQVYY